MFMLCWKQLVRSIVGKLQEDNSHSLKKFDLVGLQNLYVKVNLVLSALVCYGCMYKCTFSEGLHCGWCFVASLKKH